MTAEITPPSVSPVSYTHLDVYKRQSQGGYQLIRPIESITIYDIIALMETNTSIVNTQDERDPMKRILMREVWSLIDDNLKAYLSDLTIAELSLS